MLKRWEVIDGRTLLFEHVEYGAIRPLLDQLPQQASATASADRVKRVASTQRVLPPPRLAVAAAGPPRIDRLELARGVASHEPPPTSGPGLSVQHVQLVNCRNGIVDAGMNYYGTVYWRLLYVGNVLFSRDAGLSDTSIAITGPYFHGTAEHLTLDRWTYLANATNDHNCFLLSANMPFGQSFTPQLDQVGFIDLKLAVGRSPHQSPPSGQEVSETLVLNLRQGGILCLDSVGSEPHVSG